MRRSTRASAPTRWSSAHPDFRFYAGASLITPGGMPLGNLCVIDHVPRQLTSQEHDGLASLARQVVAQLELRRAVAELGTEAGTDALTGASNRRSFDRRLKSEWRPPRVAAQAGLAAAARHRSLQAPERRVRPRGRRRDAGRGGAAARTALRSNDLLSRLGGEEFTVVLPDTDLAGALVVAEKVRTAIANAVWRYRPVTASIGVISAVPNSTDDPYAAVAAVDRAMYLAKNNGRNCVRTLGG